MLLSLKAGMLPIFTTVFIAYTKNAMYTLIFIMDNADYEADRAYNTAKKTDLINVFWQSIHNGKNQQEAKTIQYEYAVKHNIVDVFNGIYA